MGDPEHKRKRYCLMCNVFKPDRCHHCSACNRCVLNMDHHCPWINNCIGFWNRKFFVLLLVYGLLLIYIYIIGATPAFIDSLFWHARVSYINVPINELINIGLIDVSYLFGFFLGIIISFFTRFHFRLVFRNISTLESLEKKTINFDSPYSLGSTENWFQVFGRNPTLWPFPMFLGSGKPEGNGVSWKTKETKSLYDNSQSEDLVVLTRESHIESHQ